jgi:hypothetical protein
VHVGEIVTWQGARDAPLRIDLDRHPDAHELIERKGVIVAIFLTPGAHTYTATAGDRPQWRGTVVVKPAEQPWSGDLECGFGSSDRICVAP